MNSSYITRPCLSNITHTYEVRCSKPFKLHVCDDFSVENDDLIYYLKPNPYTWLNLDAQMGILYGVAPDVKHNKPFKVTVTAGNEWGYVTKSFIIRVISTDIIETMPVSLTYLLNLRQRKYGLSHIHPYTPDLLEYIYAYYNQPELRERFHQSLREAAQEINFKLPEKAMEYKDFERLLKNINPDIEKILREQLSRDSVLLKERLNNDTLRNLFRMGSQQQGSIAIPVWNHAAYPDLYNWPNIMGIFSNVLDAASDAVARIKYENAQRANHTAPTMQRRPGSGLR